MIDPSYQDHCNANYSPENIPNNSDPIDDDIVARLRDASKWPEAEPAVLLADAADEIERLRSRSADENVMQKHHMSADELAAINAHWQKRALEAEAKLNVLCSDCPPLAYPTDKTRCDPCPRRSPAEIAPQYIAEVIARHVGEHPNVSRAAEEIARRWPSQPETRTACGCTDACLHKSDCVFEPGTAHQKIEEYAREVELLQEELSRAAAHHKRLDAQVERWKSLAIRLARVHEPYVPMFPSDAARKRTTSGALLDEIYEFERSSAVPSTDGEQT